MMAGVTVTTPHGDDGSLGAEVGVGVGAGLGAGLFWLRGQ